MRTILIFKTKATCAMAIKEIEHRLGIPTADGQTRMWDAPHKTKGGRWATSLKHIGSHSRILPQANQFGAFEIKMAQTLEEEYYHAEVSIR